MTLLDTSSHILTLRPDSSAGWQSDLPRNGVVIRHVGGRWKRGVIAKWWRHFLVDLLRLSPSERSGRTGGRKDWDFHGSENEEVWFNHSEWKQAWMAFFLCVIFFIQRWPVSQKRSTVTRKQIQWWEITQSQTTWDLTKSAHRSMGMDVNGETFK